MQQFNIVCFGHRWWQNFLWQGSKLDKGQHKSRERGGDMVQSMSWRARGCLCEAGVPRVMAGMLQWHWFHRFFPPSVLRLKCRSDAGWDGSFKNPLCHSLQKGQRWGCVSLPDLHVIMCLPVWQIQAESDHKIKTSVKGAGQSLSVRLEHQNRSVWMQIGRITKYTFLLINHKISKEPLTNHYSTPLLL